MDTKKISKATREKGQIVYHRIIVRWMAGSSSAAISARTQQIPTKC